MIPTLKIQTPGYKVDSGDKDNDSDEQDFGKRRSERVMDRKSSLPFHFYTKQTLEREMKHWNWANTKLVCTKRDGNCLFATMWKCLCLLTKKKRLPTTEEFGIKVIRWFVERHFPKACKTYTNAVENLCHAMFESNDNEDLEGVHADGIKAAYIISFAFHIDVNIFQLRKNKGEQSWCGHLHEFKFNHTRWIEFEQRFGLDAKFMSWDPDILLRMSGASGPLELVNQNEKIWESNEKNGDDNAKLKQFVGYSEEANGRNPRISFAFYHIGTNQHFDVLTNDEEPSMFNHSSVGFDIAQIMNGMLALYGEVTKKPTKRKRRGKDDSIAPSRTSSRSKKKKNDIVVVDVDDDVDDDDDDDHL
jgi:hypothetical protein